MVPGGRDVAGSCGQQDAPSRGGHAAKCPGDTGCLRVRRGVPQIPAMARPPLPAPCLAAILALATAGAAPAPTAPPAVNAAFFDGLGAAAAPLRRAVPAAERIIGIVLTAVVPGAADAPSGWARGATLARYAAAETGDPRRMESTREYSRRLLAGRPADRLTADDLIALLNADAETIRAACLEAAGTEGGPAATAAVPDLQVIACLGRFHALRLGAAVHYNLFLRAQRLAELVAATYVEKEAVLRWRELMTAVAAADHAGPRVRPLRLQSDWAADLTRLEASARDLEAQCCPPAPELLREKTWQPAMRGSAVAPAVELSLVSGGSGRITLRPSSATRIGRATLVLRAPGETGYREIPLNPAGDGALEGVLPGGPRPFEGFVALESADGVRFSPAPWERPALLRIGQR